jgi:DNA-binding CsgD family transcriptional regulator
MDDTIDPGELLKERFVLGALALLVGILTFLDMFEDLSEGVPYTHVIVEGSILLTAIVIAGYLWRRGFAELKKSNRALGVLMEEARLDAERWKEESSTLMKGLGAAIESQFERWKLSAAEGEVGLLLIKGLSHKEIAEIRNTTEKTVRQQATAVYQKANVAGRAELAAFFLEDLLLPVNN